MAGANEAEQTQQRAEQTPRKPEMATEQMPAPVSEQTPEQATQAPGFAERGRMRRRARFLRKARELAYRDLGGLVFDLHRFGQRNDQLVLAKLRTLGQIDTELRELEEVLRDRKPVTVLREVGIAACPRCAAIHGSDDRFCPGCGLAFDANADRPISTAPVSPPAQAPASAIQRPATEQVSLTPQTPAMTQASASAQPIGQPSSAAQPNLPPRVGGATPSAAPNDRPAPLDTEQTPAAKPATAAAVAKSATPPAPASLPPEHKDPRSAEEDEPTQILRPPATGK